jgi:hypothetical protein
MSKSILHSPQIRQKVDSLLSRMNLEQKIGQMTQTERMSVTPEEVLQYHLGSVLSGGGSCPGDNLPGDWVAMNQAYWLASMMEDEQHMAIPLLYGVDAIHALALMGTRSGAFNRLNYWAFRSSAVSGVLYPLLRSGRNLLLKIRGVHKINNLDLDQKDTF